MTTYAALTDAQVSEIRTDQRRRSNNNSPSPRCSRIAPNPCAVPMDTSQQASWAESVTKLREGIRQRRIADLKRELEQLEKEAS